MEIKKEYVSGISMADCDIRKYKLTIMNGVKRGKSFIQEVFIPRISEFEYGETKATYNVNGKEYKNATDAFKML